jgi:hypothetical protein
LIARPVFLLSPAHCGGRRAGLLLNPQATFDLAVKLRRSGAQIGELFAFMSGLYFRGKLAYARAFGDALVIVPGRGLVPPETGVTLADLREMAEIGVAPLERRYTEPLRRDAVELSRRLAGDAIVVLLGSIATGKYVDVIERHLDGRLRFPAAFVGRGDMSRGGLMLRCVAAGAELDYVAIPGAARHGKRPPRLTPIP